MNAGIRNLSRKAIYSILATSVTFVAFAIPRSSASADAAGQVITAPGILAHIKVLSSDEYGGRLPGTHGAELTVQYITDQFKKVGLAPGNPDGTYLQQVSLDGIRSAGSGSFRVGKRTISLEVPKDAVVRSEHYVPSVDVKNSDLVFVGYGIVAPEYHWDDYKGLDVRGKTLVMLINDPPVPDPNDPSKLDEQMFKGRAMTYYGRWTYKYEIASAKGAAAAIIVHQTTPAAYPWEVVQNSWTGEKFGTSSSNKHHDRVPVEAWMTLEKTHELFSAAGLDFDALYKAAARPDFKPVILKAQANLHVNNELRNVESYNVIGRLTGSDPKRRNEYVVYSAHWDHFGRNPNLVGNQIFHGAEDNASGVAGLIELAKAYKALVRPPARTVLFLSLTSEEQGLLGAAWYGAHPLYPLARTVADINMDGLNVWGRTRDLTIPGMGQSTLEDTLIEVAREHGRTVLPDQEPEKGYYYRADHFEFAKAGVPAITYGSGYDYIGRPNGWGLQKHQAYTAHDYHKPSDEIKPDWDLSGTVEDLRLLMDLGYLVAQSPDYPQWKSDSEFKARRDAMMATSQ